MFMLNSCLGLLLFLRCIDRRHQNDSVFITVVRIIPDHFKIATDWSCYFRLTKYILKK